MRTLLLAASLAAFAASASAETLMQTRFVPEPSGGGWSVRNGQIDYMSRDTKVSYQWSAPPQRMPDTGFDLVVQVTASGEGARQADLEVSGDFDTVEQPNTDAATPGARVFAKTVHVTPPPGHTDAPITLRLTPFHGPSVSYEYRAE